MIGNPAEIGESPGMNKTQTQPRRTSAPDVNQTAARQVATVTGTSIPCAADLTDDAELLARYEAAKAKEAARQKRSRRH